MRITITEQEKNHIKNLYYETVLDNSKPIEMLKKIKSDIDTLLDFYVKNEDGTFIDKGTSQVTNLKGIDSFYKTKIESVLFGAKQEGQSENTISQLESIKNEIINGKFEEFFGDYDLVPIKKQKFDFYTEQKCDAMNPKSPGCMG